MMMGSICPVISDGSGIVECFKERCMAWIEVEDAEVDGICSMISGFMIDGEE